MTDDAAGDGRSGGTPGASTGPDDRAGSADADGGPVAPSADDGSVAPDDDGPGPGGSTADAASPGRTRGGIRGVYRELASVVRFGQFASVGVVGAVFDNAVLAVLGLAFAVPEMWAKAAGIETAILVMFLANERWTFRGEGRPGTGPLARRLARSHLVRSGGVAVQLVTYWILTQRSTVTLVAFGTDLWFLAASPIAIGVGMFVNYVAESLFTWRVHR